MDGNITSMKGTCQEFQWVDMTIPNDMMVMVLLNSLPKNYRGYVQMITSRDETIDFEDLEPKLIHEEAKLIARGFQQQEGLDYEESPIAKRGTI